MPKGRGGKLVTKIERTDPLVAPLAKGQKVGVLKVATAAGAPVAEVPLVVVLEQVDEAGILGRAWDAIRLWIRVSAAVPRKRSRPVGGRAADLGAP